MSAFRIVKGYLPGALGRVAELHGRYYHEHWGFGLFFEAKVATELGAFLERYDEGQDGFWTVSLGDRVEGAITIDGLHGDTLGAHLRWFIVSDRLRGQGAGGQLLETAVAFCRRRHYPKIYLWTIEGLAAARHLYKKCGFALVASQKGDQWGTVVDEQRFECTLDA